MACLLMLLLLLLFIQPGINPFPLMGRSNSVPINFELALTERFLLLDGKSFRVSFCECFCHSFSQSSGLKSMATFAL